MADILLIVPHYLSLPDLLVVVEQFVSHGRYFHVIRKWSYSRRPAHLNYGHLRFNSVV